MSVVINAPLDRVMRSFFEEDALRAWWQVARAVTTPRELGAYAIEWAPSEVTDEALGRLGGVFRGTVVQFDRESGFFVADAYWLPPDGDPIGPMAFEVTLDAVASPADGAQATSVRVRQSGFEESVRWRRYYELLSGGWERALHTLRMLLEK